MPNDPRYLATADQIAARLCRDAIWDGPHCNWLGPQQEPGGLATAALGPDLYGGTAGVALFLGQVYALTGEPIYRRTALGAIAQAVAGRGNVAPALRLGLYTGWTGLAYALRRLADLCAAPALAAAARRLLYALTAPDPPLGVPADVIGGWAGAIPALLWLAGREPWTALLDLARRGGDQLLAAALPRQGGLGWRTPDQAGPPLTGLAHGAAGIGVALLELAAATGERRFQAAAAGAFAYERALFNAQEGNWPDLRPGGAGGPPGYGRAWCHGAPGGALARLRAQALTDDPRYRAEAAAALRTTARLLQDDPPALENYSMCHGRAGNADILLTAHAVLGDVAYRRIAEQIGEQGIVAHGPGGRPWPGGVPGAAAPPGLFLGLAGIGTFYLRLYDPTVPSVLLIGSEAA